MLLRAMNEGGREGAVGAYRWLVWWMGVREVPECVCASISPSLCALRALPAAPLAITGPASSLRRHANRPPSFHAQLKQKHTHACIHSQPLVAEAKALDLPSSDLLFSQARSLDELRLLVKRFRLLGTKGLEAEAGQEGETTVSDM